MPLVLMAEEHPPSLVQNRHRNEDKGHKVPHIP